MGGQLTLDFKWINSQKATVAFETSFSSMLLAAMRDVDCKVQSSLCVEFSRAGEGKGLVVHVLEGACVGFSLQ